MVPQKHLILSPDPWMDEFLCLLPGLSQRQDFRDTQAQAGGGTTGHVAEEVETGHATPLSAFSCLWQLTPSIHQLPTLCTQACLSLPTLIFK